MRASRARTQWRPAGPNFSPGRVAWETLRFLSHRSYRRRARYQKPACAGFAMPAQPRGRGSRLEDRSTNSPAPDMSPSARRGAARRDAGGAVVARASTHLRTGLRLRGIFARVTLRRRTIVRNAPREIRTFEFAVENEMQAFRGYPKCRKSIRLEGANSARVKHARRLCAAARSTFDATFLTVAIVSICRAEP